MAAEIEAKLVAYDYNTNKRASWPAEFHPKIHDIEAAVGGTVHFHTGSHRDHKPKSS